MRFAGLYVLLGCFLFWVVLIFVAFIPDMADKLHKWKLGRKKWTITEETRVHKMCNGWGNAIVWKVVGESVEGFKSGSRTPKLGDLLIVKMTHGNDGLYWFKTFVRPWSSEVHDYFNADVYYFKLIRDLTKEELVLYEKILNPPKSRFMQLV